MPTFVMITRCERPQPQAVDPERAARQMNQVLQEHAPDVHVRACYPLEGACSIDLVDAPSEKSLQHATEVLRSEGKMRTELLKSDRLQRYARYLSGERMKH